MVTGIDGRQFMVSGPPEQVTAMKQQIMSGRFSKLSPATCIDVVQGTTHNLTLNASGGQPNYTYKLLMDGSQIATYGPAPETSHTFSVTFNQAVGSHTLRGETTDSCSTGAQTAFDQCATFNILAPCTALGVTMTLS
jgi:hypothetical protein